MKLSLSDIVDQRAYDRGRDEFRARIIDLKRRRRVGVGPFVSLVFENRDTVRFQIQEMARVEKIVTDEGIQAELDAYNPLIPDPDHLTATLFLEITDPDELRRWLPELVGIETEVELQFDGAPSCRCLVDPDHARQLTRAETTASVHYITFALDAAQIAALAAGPVRLAVTHPAYRHQVELPEETRESLLEDLRP